MHLKLGSAIALGFFVFLFYWNFDTPLRLFREGQWDGLLQITGGGAFLSLFVGWFFGGTIAYFMEEGFGGPAVDERGHSRPGTEGRGVSDMPPFGRED